MDYNSKPFPVMTIDGLHYIKSEVAATTDSYELTLLCDTLWEREVLEVPATVVYQGKEYTVTGIDVGQSTKLENLRELRIPPTVRHIFPVACIGITSLRKVNIPDHCHVYAEAFAECGIEELILGEHVILEERCFEGICAKQVNIPDTTLYSPFCRESYEFDYYYELSPVDAGDMEEFMNGIFVFSMWFFMELLNKARKGDKRAEEALASSMLSRIRAYQKEPHMYPFSPDEILNLMDENEKLWISRYEENQERIINSSDDDLPFWKINFNYIVMINIRRIMWMYDNFGLEAAIKSAGYDIIATLAYMGYCLTLPFQFLWLLCRELSKDRS